MKIKKYTQKQQIKFINSIAQRSVANNKMSEMIFKSFKILETDSQKTINRKYSVLMTDLLINDRNFIIESMLNMIRTQTYFLLQGEAIADFKFGFYKSNKGNGEYIIIEDMIIATTRTGDIKKDIDLITEAPNVETALLMYQFNKAADMPKNPDLEIWVTLNGSTSWINERLKLLTSALDYPLSTYLKEEINNYTGFTDILIDDTNLKSNKEKSTALQRTIGYVLNTISNDYRKLYNEENTKGENDNFTYKIALEKIGIFFDTKSYVNNEIDYLRQLYKPIIKGTDNDFSRDWGVGDIQNMDLPEGEEVKIMAQDKFIWGVMFGSGTTPFWYSLHELKTDYIFYGSIFTKAFPGVTISFGTIANKTKQIEKKIETRLTNLFGILEKTTEMNEPIGVKDFRRKQNEAIKNIKKQIDILKDKNYLNEIIEKIVVFNGSEMLEIEDNSKTKNYEDIQNMVNENSDLKIKLIEEKMKNSSIANKKLLESTLKELKNKIIKTEKKENK